MAHPLDIHSFIHSTGCGGPHDCETSRLPHFLDNQLTDSSEDVSLMCQPSFTPRGFLVLISVIGSVDPRAILQLEGSGQMKNPVTSLEIEPVTFQLVA
jgi:hypothetical protein